jgi:hypothetical protein
MSVSLYVFVRRFSQDTFSPLLGLWAPRDFTTSAAALAFWWYGNRHSSAVVLLAWRVVSKSRGLGGSLSQPPGCIADSPAKPTRPTFVVLGLSIAGFG